MIKIYLAGPDVFRVDCVQYGHKLKALCMTLNAVGLWPFDNEANSAVEIRAANERMMREADAVIANISPFRGPGMDPGTAYEIGYARALGKPVALYCTNQSDYATRVIPDGLGVEGFGLQDNLMVCAGETVHTSPVQAILALLGPRHD